MKAFWLARSLPAVLVIIGFLSIVASAQAEVVYIGTNFDIEASSSVELGESPSLIGVTLTAVGKDGVLPVTFDSTFSGDGGTGITTAGNSLHQVWEGGFAPTPILTLQGAYPTPPDENAFPQDVDTHFLIESGQYLPGALVPGENRLVANPETGNSYENFDNYDGFGSYLIGTFALQDDPENLPSTWDFAYIVAPSGTEVFLNFELIGVDLAENTYADEVGRLEICSFTVVPEPSTLLWLALGALLLLVKKWC